MVKLTEGPLTLEQFLRLPEFKPALQFIQGRVIQKMSPSFPHGLLQVELGARLNAFARPRGLGRVGSEIRCTFGGQSQVPDLVFFVEGRVPKFVRGREPQDVLIPPDLTIEIISPGQTMAESKAKIRQALKHGARLGWLIHPVKEEVYVLRPGRRAELLKAGKTLSGEDVLPGFSLPIDELFGWLD